MIDVLYKHPETYLEACAIGFDLILILFANLQTKRGQDIARKFKVLLYLATILVIAEVCARGLFKDLKGTTLDYYAINIANSMAYLSTCYLGYGIMDYYYFIFKRRRFDWYVILNNVILVFYTIAIIVNLFTGIISLYDYNIGGFVHGVLYFPVGNLVPIFYYVSIVFVFAVSFKGIPGKLKTSLSFATLMIILGVIIQPISNISITVTGLFASLSIVTLYFTVETEDHAKLLEITESLEKARVEADNANAMKSTFLADMSHEIRTPINALSGLNDLIIKESKDEETVMYAEDMKSAIDALLATVSDVLDISKIESGEFTLDENEYHLAKVLREVNIIINSRAKDKSLEFKTEVDDNVPDRLIGDSVRLRQVIINILNNSVKYTKEGSITFKVNGKSDDEYVDLTFVFSDTGIGIKKDDIEKLFDSYTRFEADDKNKNVEGTGLGLSIVKEIIDRMNGSIKVESEYGVGTTFTIKVRQKIAGEGKVSEYTEQTGKKVEEVKAKRMVAPDAKVLVVDDNAMNLKVAKGLLKDTLVNVSTVDGGAEAIDITKQEKFDIILLDAFMPTIDGPAVFSAIREDVENPNNATPIIVVTADALADSRQKFMDMGFDEYLSKPLKQQLLFGTLFRFLPEELIEEREGE